MIPFSFLIIIALVAGAYMAWSIGANDVANAMGTSVGSGALTLKKAVIIAAVLEFLGAFFFGSHVSETVQRGIINPDFFLASPLSLAYGMISALIASGFWLQIASYYGWPVSTTHSIVGALVGFGLVVGGQESIYWKNVFFIFSSWILSPILGGIISYQVFSLFRKKIFYTLYPIRAIKKMTPKIVFLTVTFLSLIISYQGLGSIQLHLSFPKALFFSILLAFSASLLSFFLLKKIKVPQKLRLENKKYVGPEEYATVEKIFSYLQICSASMMAFSHGANDVANAIGPLHAAIAILTYGSFEKHSYTPAWILAIGGIGIVIGLATWGWRVIETIGKKITKLTPSRGFSAELGAAITIVSATRIGLPISTTHTLVGAVLGVGFARGLEAINLGMIREIFLSWIVTLPIGAISAIISYYLLSLMI